MTLIAGVCSDKTFRQKEMRSASSGVIGLVGRPDLPRWRMEVSTSMDSAVNLAANFIKLSFAVTEAK